MFVSMRHDAEEREIQHVIERIENLGLEPDVSRGVERTVIGVKGPPDKMDPSLFKGLDGVSKVIRVSAPHKLGSREWKQENTVVEVGKARFGSGTLAVIAGPCAIETEKSVLDAAHAAKAAGACMLRGGAFKPRTSPYDFQGLGIEGVKILASVGKEVGLPTITEALSAPQVEIVAEHCDMIQIGARNMQNFDLLREAGKSGKPILLKRGMSAKIKEMLMSAEYILSEGNNDVVLCERGIRTYESATRFTLDVSAVPVLKHLTHLPVIIDPSHAAGERRYVAPLAKAGIAAGADGIIVENHACPSEALCDGAQALTDTNLLRLTTELAKLWDVING